MTDQTDQEIREAREWAEYITSVRELHGNYASRARAAARFILDNTTPALPDLPDPLFGARATHPKWGEGIVMSHYSNKDGGVRFMVSDESFVDGTSYRWVDPSTLTFHTSDMSKNGAEIDTSTEHVDPIDTTPDHPLFLAKATHPERGEGVVGSYHPTSDGAVRFMFPDQETVDGMNSRWVPLSTLTFHTPDHPEFLESEEDYRSAPEGTIVAQDEGKPFVLIYELWRHAGRWTLNHDELAGIRRRVLRWGWEA